ncbi:MAG: L-2-amino-thiazoline-4-carboxylic acid hydrolase [Desulforhopalus sp.]
MSEKTIGREEAKAQVILALRRLAFYHATMVEVLKERLGDQEGRELAQEVVKRYGCKIGASARQRTDEQNLQPTALNYSEDLPFLGFEAKRLGDDPLTIRVDNCPLAEVWRELGCEEDGALYCGVDQAKYNEYNPDLLCQHKVHCLRDGKGYCDIVVTPKK